VVAVLVDGGGTPRVELPAGTPALWNPRLREVSHAANAISLMMPHVEPYFVRTVRAALPQLDGELRAAAQRFVAEESAHHAAHRRYNAAVLAAQPKARCVQRSVAWVCRWMSATRSLRWNLAFAAGAEGVGFALARWTDRHLRALRLGAEPAVAELFLWHLAEEVAHKEVAFDVWAAVDGSRWRYLRATALATVLLAALGGAGTLVLLAGERRLRRPATWLRLARWSLSCVFGVLPTVLVSVLPGHHPSQLADPDGYAAWQLERALADARA
jgi:predicted metal-dependent hydrolase